MQPYDSNLVNAAAEALQKAPVNVHEDFMREIRKTAPSTTLSFRFEPNENGNLVVFIFMTDLFAAMCQAAKKADWTQVLLLTQKT